MSSVSSVRSEPPPVPDAFNAFLSEHRWRWMLLGFFLQKNMYSMVPVGSSSGINSHGNFAHVKIQPFSDVLLPKFMYFFCLREITEPKKYGDVFLNFYFINQSIYFFFYGKGSMTNIIFFRLP